MLRALLIAVALALASGQAYALPDCAPVSSDFQQATSYQSTQCATTIFGPTADKCTLSVIQGDLVYQCGTGTRYQVPMVTWGAHTPTTTPTSTPTSTPTRTRTPTQSPTRTPT